jgi:hypothetical protein
MSLPSAALAGTDSMVSWAVVDRFQKVKSETRREEREIINIVTFRIDRKIER